MWWARALERCWPAFYAINSLTAFELRSLHASKSGLKCWLISIIWDRRFTEKFSEKTSPVLSKFSEFFFKKKTLKNCKKEANFCSNFHQDSREAFIQSNLYWSLEGILWKLFWFRTSESSTSLLLKQQNNNLANKEAWLNGEKRSRLQAD